MSRAVLVTAGSSPTSTPSNRLVTTTVAAVAPGTPHRDARATAAPASLPG
ncbi:hypothetical protein PV518_08800 [Streptomyces sp. ND04-05B]|nr:hypothetical protein [Streptomyces sp. ND04-05B]MDX3062280.1 hypothetical protein [Streptomyces sp. ND04-05B]